MFYNFLRKTIPKEKPAPKPRKSKIKEMGEIDYRKWANNWDPVVEISRIHAKVNTNVRNAQMLSKLEQLKKRTSKKGRSANTSRCRETYFDLERKQYKRRYPSKEAVNKHTYHSTNRFKSMPKRARSLAEKEWMHTDSIF